MNRLSSLVIGVLALVSAGCGGDSSSPSAAPSGSSTATGSGSTRSPSVSSPYTSLADETGDQARRRLAQLVARVTAADTGAFEISAGFDGTVLATKGVYRVSDQSSATSVVLQSASGPISYATVSDADHVWLKVTKTPQGDPWPCWLEADASSLATVDRIFPGAHLGLPSALALVTGSAATEVHVDDSLQVDAALVDLFDTAASPLREIIGIDVDDAHTLGLRLDPAADDGSFISLSYPVIELLSAAEQDGYVVPKDLDAWRPDRRQDNEVAVAVRDLGRGVTIDRPTPGDSVLVKRGGEDTVRDAVASCSGASA